MNKFFIAMMAMCLISVHAFVKREEPTTEKQFSLEDIQKGIEGLSKKAADAFDPEMLKAGINNIIDELTKTVDKIKNSVAARTAEEKQ